MKISEQWAWKMPAVLKDSRRPVWLGCKRDKSELVEFGTIMKNGLSFRSQGVFQRHWERTLSGVCFSRVFLAAVLASAGTVRCYWKGPGKKGEGCELEQCRRKAGDMITELLCVFWGKAWLDSWRIGKRGWGEYARITPRLFDWGTGGRRSLTETGELMRKSVLRSGWWDEWCGFSLGYIKPQTPMNGRSS